jgi:3D (Asp-Asp-Asp) domain-containing protein
MSARLAAFLFASCLAGPAIGASQEDFSLPPPPDTQGAGLDLWATNYYVHSARELASGMPLRDKRGNALTGGLSPRDWCLGAIEGTIQVISGSTRKTLNYAGTGRTVEVDCAAVLKIDPKRKPWIRSVGKSVFAPAKGPFGDGVAGFVLVPFRTVAVDPARIPFGTALYVPSARGAEITVAPGLTIKHDGYFFAADTGGAIKGQHIDVFCGDTPSNCFPSFISSTPSKGFKAFIANDIHVVLSLKAMHRQ